MILQNIMQTIEYIHTLRKFQARSVAAASAHFLVLFLFISLFGLSLSAQTTGPSQRIELIHADSLRSNTLPGGEEVMELLGNVQLRQGMVTIKSNRAIYYSSGDRAILTGDVVINQPGTVLTAPQVDYNGATGLATAPSGVTIKEDEGTLTAGYGEYYNNRRISYFRNNLTLRDSNVTVTSSSGTYFSTERKAIFEGNVNAKSDSGELTSNELTYWRDSEQSFAVGNVRLFSLADSSILTCDTLNHRPDVETFALGHVILTSAKESAILSGDSLRHRPEEEYTIVTGSPKLTQVDSTLRLVDPSDTTTSQSSNDTATAPDSLAERLDTIQRGDSLFTVRRDTTTITAQKLERFTKERKEFVATGDAHIMREKLEAIAEIARYFEDEEIVALGPGRAGPTSDLPMDSVASDTGNVVEGTDAPPEEETEPVPGDPVPALVGPIVWYDNSQLTGDTITVYLKEKKLHMIDVMGSAFVISSGDVPERYDQLASERMIFNVEEETVRSIHANGAAASIYFIYEEKAPNGLNRSSGDTIVIRFADGKASHVGIYGPRTRLEGEVIPEKDISGRETVYRLSGFNRYERQSLAVDSSTTPEETQLEEEQDEEIETPIDMEH